MNLVDFAFWNGHRVAREIYGRYLYLEPSLIAFPHLGFLDTHRASNRSLGNDCSK